MVIFAKFLQLLLEFGDKEENELGRNGMLKYSSIFNRAISRTEQIITIVSVHPIGGLVVHGQIQTPPLPLSLTGFEF